MLQEPPAPDNTADSALASNVFHKVLWSAAGNQGAQVLMFVFSCFYARYLNASDFGLFALIQIAVVFVAVFSEGGVRILVLQRDRSQSYSDREILGYAMVMGLGFACAIILSASAISRFYCKPNASLALMAIALTIPASASFGVYTGVVQRNGDFKSIAYVSFGSILASGIVGAWLAVEHAGYWALVAQSIARAFMQVSLAFIVPSVRAVGLPHISVRRIREVSRMTQNLIAFDLINFVHRNIDRLLIGKTIGLNALGEYTRGYTLLQTFNQALSGTLAPVFHATCAQPEVSIVKVKDLYELELRRALWVACPTMGSVAAVSDAVIRITWGPNWNSASEVFHWLAIAGMHQPVFGYFGAVFNICGKSWELLVCAVITTTLFSLAITVGVYHGIEMIAFNYMIASWVVASGVTAYVWTQLLRAKLHDLTRCVSPPIAAGCICSLICNLLTEGLFAKQSGLVEAILQVSIGVVIALLTIGIFGRKQVMGGLLRI